MMATLNRRAEARRGAGRVTDAVHRHLLAFFDAYVRGDQQALAAVTRNQTAPEPGAMIELQHLPAIAPAITRREFRRLLDENPSRAGAAAREGLVRDPLASVFEEEYLNLLGYELLNQRQGEKAIEVLRLNVDAHPGSANSMDSLSEAFELIGQPAAAVEWAEKALAALAGDTTVPPWQRNPLEDGLRGRIAKLKK
jgi:tetratricopeptide (TPR) repeat protein